MIKVSEETFVLNTKLSGGYLSEGVLVEELRINAVKGKEEESHQQKIEKDRLFDMHEM